MKKYLPRLIQVAVLFLIITAVYEPFPINSALFHYCKGAALYKMRLYNNALSSLDNAIYVREDFPRAYVLRAKIHKRITSTYKAIPDLDRAIRLKPDYIEAYYLRGKYLHGFGATIGDFSKVIELDPDCMDAYLLRAQEYYFIDEDRKAISDLNKYIDYDDDSVEAYFLRGHCYRRIKNYDSAISDFDKVIKLDPGYSELGLGYVKRERADAFLLRGIARYKSGNYEGAIADINESLQIIYSDKYAYYWRSAAYRGLGEYEKALSDISKAISYDRDNDGSFYYERGIIYSKYDKTYDIDKAVTDFRKGCEFGDSNSCDKLKELLEE